MTKHIALIAATLAALPLAAPAFADDILPQTRAQVAADGAFPPMSHATRRQGAFVPATNIALVAPGLKKSEVYTLLDVPHFHEGLIGVRTWNYILNFYTGHGDEFRQCQYQIRYDSHVRVASTSWKDADCAALYEQARDKPKPVVQYIHDQMPAVVNEEKPIKTLSFTFAFNKSDINSDGHKVIASAIEEAAHGSYRRIVVSGFTDTVGSTNYNDGLAARRAAATVAELTDGLTHAGSPMAHQTFSRGGRDLSVETGPGVREERNRRAVIEFF